jgi:hypothetical protein
LNTEATGVIKSVQKWVESIVVDLDLCPFARHELINHGVRFTVSEATSEEHLLSALDAELGFLNNDESIETTLLIHPHVLQNFYDYNEFLNRAEDLLVQMNLSGVYQLASFHPQYQFAGTQSDDVENYTNRSPYPILHLIREASLTERIKHYPGVENIPLRNIALMKDLGKDKLDAMLQACFDT